MENCGYLLKFSCLRPALSRPNVGQIPRLTILELQCSYKDTSSIRDTYKVIKYDAHHVRVVNCGEGELGYHIFYQMIEGSDDSLRRELQLGSRATENNDFLPPLIEVRHLLSTFQTVS